MSEKKEKRKRHPEAQRVVEGETRTVEEPEWEIMEAMNRALSNALAEFVEKQTTPDGTPGIKLETLFMATHNWHKLVLLNIAMEQGLPPRGRADFYRTAKETFMRGMDAMILACENEARVRRVNRIPLTAEAD